MTPKARGEALERSSACVRCTSWTHQRDACPVSIVSCKEQIDGSQCGRDHSKLVCQSGVAYCVNLTVSAGIADGSGISHVDEEVPTIPYVQDLTIKSNSTYCEARSFWDNGSNRMLINNEFAAENQMLPRPVTVIMKVAGGDSKRLNANIFEFQLVERDGTCHSVWAYGVDSIVESEDPIDPSPLQSLFPHISKDVFKKLMKLI